eukprot:jgi/Mesvir1/15714/Mv03294-RA.1
MTSHKLRSSTAFVDEEYIRNLSTSHIPPIPSKNCRTDADDKHTKARTTHRPLSLASTCACVTATLLLLAICVLAFAWDFRGGPLYSHTATTALLSSIYPPPAPPPVLDDEAPFRLLDAAMVNRMVAHAQGSVSRRHQHLILRPAGASGASQGGGNEHGQGGDPGGGEDLPTTGLMDGDAVRFSLDAVQPTTSSDAGSRQRGVDMGVAGVSRTHASSGHSGDGGGGRDISGSSSEGTGTGSGQGGQASSTARAQLEGPARGRGSGGAGREGRPGHVSLVTLLRDGGQKAHALTSPRTIVVLQGSLLLYFFDDNGNLTRCTELGQPDSTQPDPEEESGAGARRVVGASGGAGVDISPGVWHAFSSSAPATTLLMVQDPDAEVTYAHWGKIDHSGWAGMLTWLCNAAGLASRGGHPHPRDRTPSHQMTNDASSLPDNAQEEVGVPRTHLTAFLNPGSLPLGKQGQAGASNPQFRGLHVRGQAKALPEHIRGASQRMKRAFPHGGHVQGQAMSLSGRPRPRFTESKLQQLAHNHGLVKHYEEVPASGIP